METTLSSESRQQNGITSKKKFFFSSPGLGGVHWSDLRQHSVCFSLPHPLLKFFSSGIEKRTCQKPCTWDQIMYVRVSADVFWILSSFKTWWSTHPWGWTGLRVQRDFEDLEVLKSRVIGVLFCSDGGAKTQGIDIAGFFDRGWWLGCCWVPSVLILISLSLSSQKRNGLRKPPIWDWPALFRAGWHGNQNTRPRAWKDSSGWQRAGGFHQKCMRAETVLFQETGRKM